MAERDKVAIAKEMFEDKIRELEREIEKLKWMKERFLQMPEMMDDEALPTKQRVDSRDLALQTSAAEAAVRDVSRWPHMRLPEAAKFLLLENGNVALELGFLLAQLASRGVRLGKQDKPRRFEANLKAAISNNKKTFKYDKATGMVSLKKMPRVTAAPESKANGVESSETAAAAAGN